MRLIRHKLQTPTKVLLKELASDLNTEFDYVIDLYALMTNGGGGIPSEDRLARMIPLIAKKSSASEVNTGIFAKLRRRQLRQIVSDPLFHAFGQQTSKVTGLRMYITASIEISLKAQQAKCKTCPHLAACAFGTEYGATFNDPAKVLDPNFKNKVHPDCPDFPAIERTNQIAGSVNVIRHMFSPQGEEDKKLLKQMPAENNAADALAAGRADSALSEATDELDEGSLEEDSEDDNFDPEDDTPFYAGMSGAGKARSLRRLFTNLSAENYKALIASLTQTKFLLWELGRKFSVALSSKGKGKDVKAESINHSTREEKMERHSDITSIVPTQHGLPEEVFKAKLEKKELVKVQHRRPEKKRKIVYLLIDSSGSMKGFLSHDGRPTKRTIFTRNALSSVFASAMIRKVEEDDGYAFVRFFGGCTTQCFIGRDKASFALLRRQVASNNYNGGGTDICHSVSVATQDIAKAAFPDVSKSEILLITDCQDSFDASKLKEALGTSELNVLDVSGGSFKTLGVSGLLKATAAHYYKVDETVDVRQMIQTLK